MLCSGGPLSETKGRRSLLLQHESSPQCTYIHLYRYTYTCKETCIPGYTHTHIYIYTYPHPNKLVRSFSRASGHVSVQFLQLWEIDSFDQIRVFTQSGLASQRYFLWHSHFLTFSFTTVVEAHLCAWSHTHETRSPFGVQTLAKKLHTANV